MSHILHKMDWADDPSEELRRSSEVQQQVRPEVRLHRSAMDFDYVLNFNSKFALKLDCVLKFNSKFALKFDCFLKSNSELSLKLAFTAGRL